MRYDRRRALLCSVAVALLFVAVQPARALINQDIDQVLAEYGKPSSVSHSEYPAFSFYFKDIKIIVTFYDGRSQCENYIPIGRDLAASEIADLLKRNGRTSEFRINQELSGADRDVWETADKLLIAYAPRSGVDRGCVVATKNYIALRTAE
jgi:hypothetical protein